MISGSSSFGFSNAINRHAPGSEGIGMVPLDARGEWRGGRYYLHHLIRSVAALPIKEQEPIYDVSWISRPEEDSFEEVRPLLSGHRLIAPPKSPLARGERKLRQLLRHTANAQDLFKRSGISVLFPILPCENPGIPFVFWLTDFQHLYLPNLYTPELRLWFENQNDRHVQLATRVVLSSRHAYDDFQRIYPKHAAKGRILSFASLPDDSWWLLNSKAVAQKHGITAPYIIVSNQFAHNKNHDVLFAAMRILNDRGVNVQLVCTGSTNGFHGSGYYERLTDYIKDHRIQSIKILGLLPRAEQIALLRGALALAQPSRFEGWSTIIEDAKAIQQLVLASDFPVHREQLKHEGGIILPMDDADAWAVAFSDLVEAHIPGAAQPLLADIELRAKAVAVETGRAFLSIMGEARAAF